MGKYRRKSPPIEAVKYVIEGAEDGWTVIDNSDHIYPIYRQDKIICGTKPEAVEAMAKYPDPKKLKIAAVVRAHPGWYIVREGDWIVTDEHDKRHVYTDQRFHEYFEPCPQ